jgi:hypothetical protein
MRKKKQTTAEPIENRIYRVKWNGTPQPLNSNSWQSVVNYITRCLSIGNCYLWQFEIFDQYGQLNTNIVTDPNADPTHISNYFQTF